MRAPCPRACHDIVKRRFVRPTGSDGVMPSSFGADGQGADTRP
jgi:hypothetical protein